MSHLSDKHEAYYALQKKIEEEVSRLPDKDIWFAFWLNQGDGPCSNEGTFENAISLEYYRRKLDKRNPYNED